MPLRSLSGVLCFCWLCLLALAPLDGQSGGSAPSPGYTLRSETRSVLTDVTVTDRDGNPVRGLKASAFHIFDDDRPQDLASFEEHTAGDTAASAPVRASVPGVYSNDLVRHPPPLLNVLLLDTTNLPIQDQMYLRYQLTKFLQTLKPGESLAVYARNGPMVLQLQEFTADHALLAAAIHRALPRFMPPGREYLSDAGTLHQMAVYLNQLPGRKNILWFSGGSSAFLLAGGIGALDMTVVTPDMRPFYDELEASRIAVYPIDARGLTVASGRAMIGQHTMMSEAAESTGGQAFYSNNGLAQIATHVVETDGGFYSLTYSPHGFQYDNNWHKVRVVVDGNGYRLSYRRGYFADGSNGDPAAAKLRAHLLEDGTTEQRRLERDVPIVFAARVVPGAVVSSPRIAGDALSVSTPKRGTTPLTIRYYVPADSLTRKMIDGRQRVVIGLVLMAFDHNGEIVDRVGDQFTLGLNEEALRSTPHASVPLQEQIALKKGNFYLYLTVWDMTSGHMGTLEMPVRMPLPAKETEAAIVP
jgi:VWFA-related protein